MTSSGKGTLDGVDRLDQLFARSLHEIEAHAGELGPDGGRRLLDQRSCAAARGPTAMGANPVSFGSAVREILEAVEEVSLMSLIDDLGELGGRDSQAARGTLTAAVKLPREHLSAIASYAFRAL